MEGDKIKPGSKVVVNKTKDFGTKYNKEKLER
jgi:hypothetical protein